MVHCVLILFTKHDSVVEKCQTGLVSTTCFVTRRLMPPVNQR